MSLRKSSKQLENLKIGDIVLLFYNADKRFVAESGAKSGFILADLSGLVGLIARINLNFHFP